MARPEFRIEKKERKMMVGFEIPGGVTTPQEFAEAVEELEDLAGDHVLLISGRGPIWGHEMLMHLGHPTLAVGVFDPRMGGFVVVATHSPEFHLGEVIPA